jgi:hypothetical protein
MVNQKSVTGMEYTITVIFTVNCTVCHVQETLFFLGHIAFNANSVNKTSSVSLQHCADHRIQYRVCVTAVLHKH